MAKPLLISSSRLFFFFVTLPFLTSYCCFLMITTTCGASGGCGGDQAAETCMRGMFVFGSSLVDNGNNNFLAGSRTRANYPPYGIDFPSGPSGRFSNGRNPIDVLAELLRLPDRISPFLDPRTTGERILHGVNYASGGSGILDQTGPLKGRVISLNQQIRNFQGTTLPQLRAQLGGDDGKLSKELSQYLFVVGTGGNDCLLNYFLRGGASGTVSLQDFTTNLTTTLFAQLKKLHGLGARKFVLFSVQAMGCAPVVREILLASNGSCVEAINEAALLFNTNVRAMVDGSSSTQMPRSHMAYVNSYKIIRDIIRSPRRSGNLLITTRHHHHASWFRRFLFLPAVKS